VLATSLPAAESEWVDPLRPAQFQSAVKKAEKAQSDAQPDPSASWRLTAVLIAPERSVAVIDGRSLELGAEFEGYELSEINADRVVLKSSQRVIVLRRSGSGLKKNLIERSSAQGS
jgi:hypothetical protein